MFPLLIVMNVLYQHRVDRFSSEAQEHLGELSAAVHESFDGVPVVKAFGAEERETERLAVIAGRLREAQRARGPAAQPRSSRCSTPSQRWPTSVLVVFGALRVQSGAITVGDVTSFVYLFTLLVFPLRLIGFALSRAAALPGRLDRVRRITERAGRARPGRRASAARARDVRGCALVAVPLRRAGACSAASTSTSPAGAPSPSSARPAPARRRCCTCSPGWCRCEDGR